MIMSHNKTSKSIKPKKQEKTLNREGQQKESDSIFSGKKRGQDGIVVLGGGGGGGGGG